MKLALLIYGSLDTLSGGYLYDRKLVEHLRARGDSVEIITLPWRNYAAHLTDNFSRQLFERLRNLAVDALIQDELNHPSLWLLNSRLRPYLNYPILSLVHHLRASEKHPAGLLPIYRAVERKYLNSVDGYLFNSNTTRGVVEQLTNRTRPAIVAQPAGDRLPLTITPDEIRQRVSAGGPLKILFLGTVMPRKGLHTLLAALAHLPANSWQLTIVGDLRVASGYVRQMRNKIEAQGWQAQVQFTGAIQDDRLLKIMRSQHVLAMPSQYEGFGIAYLEGMGLGLPAIGTTAGAAHEIITEGQDGFLVPPESPADLAHRLALLIDNPTMLLQMSRAARQRFLRQPTWEQSMAKIRAFLHEFKND